MGAPDIEKARGGDTAEAVDSLVQQSLSLLSGEDPTRLLELAERVVEMSRRLGYARGEAYGWVQMGFARWFLADFEQARRNLLDGRALFERIEDEVGMAKARLGLMSVEKSLGIYDQSLANNLESLAFFRRTGDRFWEALCLIGLATLHFDVGDVDRSVELYEQLLPIGRELGVDWMMGRALVGLGAAHQARKEYEKARGYYRESLERFEACGNRIGKARALNDLGSIHQERGELELAFELYQQALAIRREIRQRAAQATTLIQLGTLFQRKGDCAAALESLHEALDIAAEVQSKPKTYQAHQALADVYQSAGDFARALEHHRLYHETREAVLSQEANARLKNLQTRFDVEKAEKEAEIARLMNVELREKNEQLERLLDELQATQAQLVLQGKMASLGKLVAGLAHELNTPAGSIQSSNQVRGRCLERLKKVFREAESLEAIVGSDEFQKLMRLLGEAEKVSMAASARIATIVKSLAAFARLDEAELQWADVRRGLDHTLELLPGARRDEISIVKEYDSVPRIRCYPAELNQVFLTLLTNAAEAIEKRGAIRVRVREESGAVRIEVSDDGRGIPPDRLERLFDYGFARDGTRIKMSTGLVSARKIVSDHGGTIDVESEPGRGTTVTIRLPMDGLSLPRARTLAGKPAQ